MIIKRKYYSEKKDEEDKKKSSKLAKAGKIAGSIGAVAGVGIGSNYLINKGIRNTEDKMYKLIQDNYKLGSKKEEGAYESAISKIENKYKRLDHKLDKISDSMKGKKGLEFFNRNSERLDKAYHSQKDKANKIYNNNLDNLSKKKKDSIAKLEKNMKKMKLGGKIGSGVLGLSTGIGAYYLLNRKKKNKNKKDVN